VESGSAFPAASKEIVILFIIVIILDPALEGLRASLGHLIEGDR